jgi:BlaI family transcriptional regulator, penicillinase repressor
MKHPKSEPHPTEGELAILRVLWARRDPTTVREVHAALSRSRETAYTTVLKMMTIMADKGLVNRDASERSHLYTAAHPQPVVQSVLLRDLMQRAFAGSAAQLVQSALESDSASPDELDAIATMIAEARARRDQS